MTRKEYRQKKNDIQEEIRKLQKESAQLDIDYATEVMERNGYKVGQRVAKNGKEGEVVGAEMFAMTPRLKVNKLKKDGTVSQIYSYELSDYLKEI